MSPTKKFLTSLRKCNVSVNEEDVKRYQAESLRIAVMGSGSLR